MVVGRVPPIGAPLQPRCRYTPRDDPPLGSLSAVPRELPPPRTHAGLAAADASTCGRILTHLPSRVYGHRRAHAAAHGAQMSCPFLLELDELPQELHAGMDQLAATYTRRVFLRRVPLPVALGDEASYDDQPNPNRASPGVDGLATTEEGGACGVEPPPGDAGDSDGSAVQLVGAEGSEEPPRLVAARDAADANTVRVRFEVGEDGQTDERWVRGRWLPHANTFVVTYGTSSGVYLNPREVGSGGWLVDGSSGTASPPVYVGLHTPRMLYER